MFTRLACCAVVALTTGCAFNPPPAADEAQAPKERFVLTGSRIPHKVDGISGTKVINREDAMEDLRRSNRMPAQPVR